MLNFIDNFLNKITMYRLTLYYLLVLLGIALVLSFFGLLPFKPLDFAMSGIFLLAVSWVTNNFFAYIFDVPANIESIYITVCILALLILPATDVTTYMFLFWAAAIAQASKYILAIKRKHVFNPAALAVVVTAYTIAQGAVWWVGNKWMLLPVLIGGVLVVRKIRRWDMVYAFVLTALAVSFGFAVTRGMDTVSLLKQELVDSPLFFFAFVMFTEPLTTPPTKSLQIIYGILVGVLFTPFVHFGSIYLTPEEALLIGNIYSFLVSPKAKLLLTLKEKLPIGHGQYDFVFNTDQKLQFHPGQYLEWTLGHDKSDNRGNRRYFTIASAPTEDNLRIGVKFYTPSSSFKKALGSLNPGQTIAAGSLAGDFTLPKDQSQKLVFMAGGIGITPFRSMLKFLSDTNQKRDIIMFFSNRSAAELVYLDVLEEAYEKLGVRVICTLTDDIPADWKGERGRLSADMVSKYVPDFRQRTFYISGTHAMVESMKDLLSVMGIPSKQIKTDFFPGFV